MVAKKRKSCKSPQRKEHVRMPGLDNSEMRELQLHVNEIREQDTEWKTQVAEEQKVWWFISLIWSPKHEKLTKTLFRNKIIKHLGPWFSLRRERRRSEWRTLWQLSEELTATLHFWETEFLCLSIFCTLNLLCKYSFVHLALLFDKPIKNSFCQKSKEEDKYLSYKTRTF